VCRARNIDPAINAEWNTVRCTADSCYQRQRCIRVRLFGNRQLSTECAPTGGQNYNIQSGVDVLYWLSFWQKTGSGRYETNCKGTVPPPLRNAVKAYSRATVSTDTVSAVYRGPKTKLENYRNKRSISFKPRAKRERAVTWWNTAAQTRPVLDSYSFVPVPTLKRHNPLLSYVQQTDSTQ
jgi:hypothetical protein